MTNVKQNTQNPESKHKGETVATVDSFDVIECEFCGFKHTLPLLSEEEIQKLYTEEFYDTDKSDYFKRVEEDKDWWMLSYNHYYEIIEQHTSGRRLLDVGSGPGYFLLCGKERGWDVLGFEPSPQAAQYSKNQGLTVVNEIFTPEKAREHGLFDAVSLNFVIEHLRDPIGFLDGIKNVLRPGGVIFIVSPNDFNPLQQVLQSGENFTPWWVSPRHHLNYFNFVSIERLLVRSGYRVVEREATFPMEFFLLGGRNYVGNDELGRVCHDERKKFESALYHKNKELLQSLYRGLVAHNIGRECLIWAKLEEKVS